MILESERNFWKVHLRLRNQGKYLPNFPKVLYTAKDLLNIYKGDEEISDVKIYNSRGLLVIEKFYAAGQTNIQINISNLQNGLYYVKIKTSQEEYTEQLVILR